MSRVRSDYDKLQTIQEGFVAEAQTIGALLATLKECIEPLQKGEWTGAGAELFYAEMQGEVLPTVERLQEALRQAAATTAQMIELLKQAEKDVAAVWNTVPTAPPPDTPNTPPTQ